MYAVFDIGGTNSRVAVSTDCFHIQKPQKFKTPSGYREGIERIATHILTQANGAALTACAGGLRGNLTKDKTGISHDTVLTDWHGKPFTTDLSRALGGVPVTVENDAAAAGLGEAHNGAGKGYEIVAYHTVSTGVGGARIVNGSIDEASTNFEPGKQIVDIDTTLRVDASMLEELISGSAVEKLRGVKPYEIPQDDELWDDLARILAYGLKNTIAYWSPDVIVLGGSMILGDPRIRREDITKHLHTVLASELPSPPVLDAKLGDYGGLYGGMAILKKVKKGHKNKVQSKESRNNMA